MKTDTLDALNDDELRSIIAHSQELLNTHDRERKEQALIQARATLAAAGLTLKDLGTIGRSKGRASVYHNGHSYQHPANKALVWNAKGQKPNWLRELEAKGGKPTEITAG